MFLCFTLVHQIKWLYIFSLHCPNYISLFLKEEKSFKLILNINIASACINFFSPYD